MASQSTGQLQVGAWRVDPTAGEISRAGVVQRIEARAMRLLLCLAERPGELVSQDELLEKVWAGVVVTPDSVYQAVAALRRHLEDDPRQPAYIATVPRLGYRMVAKVAPWPGLASAPPDGAPATAQTGPTPRQPRIPRRAAVALVALALSATAAYLLGGHAPPDRSGALASVPARSVAVLPFLDLTTQAMNEEFFADGMTEELIGDLSRVPGLRVPAPTASFRFKGRQLPVPEIARELGVAYVLDGSVRKSGTVYRVAVRLMRAANGYVVYSGAYERPLGDLLAVQKGIAAEAADGVRKAMDAADRDAR